MIGHMETWSCFSLRLGLVWFCWVGVLVEGSSICICIVCVYVFICVFVCIIFFVCLLYYVYFGHANYWDQIYKSISLVRCMGLSSFHFIFISQPSKRACCNCPCLCMGRSLFEQKKTIKSQHYFMFLHYWHHPPSSTKYIVPNHRVFLVLCH